MVGIEENFYYQKSVILKDMVINSLIYMKLKSLS